MRSFNEYSDEQLVELYRQGDESAIDFLYNKYKDLVRKKAKAMYIVGGDSDDLIQEGMIGLYKAIRDYNISKEASFRTFASMCINRQMCTAVTMSNRKKHSPLNSYISLDSPVKSEHEEDNTRLSDILYSEDELNPESIFIDKESTDYIENRIGHVLSSYEKEVLHLQIDGLDYIKIAEVLEKSPKSVDNALQRIRNKLSGIMK